MHSSAAPRAIGLNAFGYIVAALLAFLLYLGSAIVLDFRHATTHFGADAYVYEGLAKGIVHERIARFHPLTIGSAAIWMKLFGWLSPWVEAKYILKAMFAAFGAGGAAAALAAFIVFVPRREAMLCTTIYTFSFGVWYFASIEESKIVTATLASIYIALYLRIRESPSIRANILLFAVFIASCLNEITSCFLAALPAVDLFLRHSKEGRRYILLGMHMVAGVVSLAALEFLARVALPNQNDEGASHASMFLYYFFKSDHTFNSFYQFISNWLLFNIVAPTATAIHLASTAQNSAGYFPPGLGQYLGYPFALIALAILAILFTLGWSQRATEYPAGILIALAVYSLVRGMFFFLFNPAEPLLFSTAVTLALLVVLIAPFAQTEYRWRSAALIALAACMLIANGAFIVGI